MVLHKILRHLLRIFFSGTFSRTLLNLALHKASQTVSGTPLTLTQSPHTHRVSTQHTSHNEQTDAISGHSWLAQKSSHTHLSRQTSNTQFIQTRNLPTNKEICKKNCRQARGDIKARSAWQYQGWNTRLLTCILGARHGSCEASKFALFGLVGNCKPRPRLKLTWSHDCFAKTIE